MLVLCEVADLSALWAAGRLQARGVPVDIVTASVLGSALSWEHLLSKDGDASVAIDLGDGRTITNRDPVGVLNRLAFAPTDRLDKVGGTDRDYAVQELNALFLSWLNAMPGPECPDPVPGTWCRADLQARDRDPEGGDAHVPVLRRPVLRRLLLRSGMLLS